MEPKSIVISAAPPADSKKRNTSAFVSLATVLTLPVLPNYALSVTY